jgi:hypothetical protein
MQITPLYYASIAGLTGIAFAIGHSTLFAPCESESLHLVPDGVELLITARVPSLFAGHLTATVIAPRLAQLGVRL